MTVDDREAWDLAGELLKQFSEDAAFVAAQRADAFLDQGEMDAFDLWVRVTRHINALEKPEARG